MTNLFKITGTVTLKKGAGRQLKSGGMWVYDNEIDTFSETVEDGGLIELHDFDDYFMGIGFVNRRSKITVRMLSRHEGEINEEFIKQRVKDAFPTEWILSIHLPAGLYSERQIFFRV